MAARFVVDTPVAGADAVARADTDCHRGRTVSSGRTSSPPLPERSPLRRLAAIAIAALPALAMVAGASATAARAASAGTNAPAEACCSNPERFWRACVVVRSSPDTLTVRFAEGGNASLALSTVALRNAAAALRWPGDALVMVGNEANPQALVAIGARVPAARRLAVMVAVALALAGLVALILGGQVQRLSLGLDGRHSGSTWQMLVWFTVLVIAYGATVVLRTWAGGLAYTGGVGVPGRLLAQAGLSALTFAGARAIRHVKEVRAARTRAAPGAPAESAKPRARFPGDLVRDERGRPDIGNIQLVVVTVIAATIYLVRLFAWLAAIELACTISLPELDTVLLGATSVGYGTYLAKKAATPLGGG